jgi:hypothetical protein
MDYQIFTIGAANAKEKHFQTLTIASNKFENLLNDFF